MSERKRNPAKTVPIPRHLKAELAARDADLVAADEAWKEATERRRQASLAVVAARAAIEQALEEGDAGLPIIAHDGRRLVIISRTASGIVTRPVGKEKPKKQWKFTRWGNVFCMVRSPNTWSRNPEIPLADVDAVFPLTEVSDG